MSDSVSVSAVGTSPIFSITAEEYLLKYFQSVTKIPGDWVPPPTLGPQGGMSEGMKITNDWFPWIDEKLVEPKYDGVCQYLGIASNRPSFIKDYHMITLNRAVDRILAPAYVGVIRATVTGTGPGGPPI
jgi:hypothetical protein